MINWNCDNAPGDNHYSIQFNSIQSIALFQAQQYNIHTSST